MKKINLKLQKNKKLYFAGDFHLGRPNEISSIQREKHIVKWLDTIKKDAQEIFLMGDVFDFWFEYKKTVPKGYIRLLGKFIEIIEEKINIHYFVGNHDMWTLDYFQNLGFKIIIVTNQSGIARGYYSENDFRNITSWMIQQFKRNTLG